MAKAIYAVQEKIKGKDKGGKCLQYSREIQGRLKALLLGNYPSWPRVVLHHLLSVLQSHSANACHVQQAKETLGKENISKVIFLISSKLINNLLASVLLHILKSQIYKGRLQKSNTLLLRVERTENFTLREGGETIQSDRKRCREKWTWTLGNQVEICLIYSIPIHLAVSCSLHLNYQLTFPKYPCTHGGKVVEDF